MSTSDTPRLVVQDEQDLDKWVALATRVRTLRAKALAYLTAFYNANLQFFALQDRTTTQIHVTSTVFSVLELLSDPSLLDQFKLRVDPDVETGVAKRLRRARVTSEGHPEFNMYTAPVFVVGLANLKDPLKSNKAQRAIQAVLDAIDPQEGSVRWNQLWEPSGFLTYWCWRAVKEAGPRVEDALSEQCGGAQLKIEKWADREIHRELVLGMTRQSDFDPMQLGYALTICMAQGDECPVSSDIIDAAFAVLFGAQAQNGMWPASSGIFPNGERGTVYVFPPEMFALLFAEARRRPTSVLAVYEGLERLVSWIEDNERLPDGGSGGWVSNHLPFKSSPESWSTVAVLGALRELDRLSRSIITEIVIRQFKGTVYRKSDNVLFDNLLDCDIELGGKVRSAKGIIAEYVITPNLDPRTTIDARRCVILFGPPGTAKTTYAEAVARALGWPLISIRMGHFLAHGIDRAAAEADEIFRKLLEAENVVVLFDEVDELVKDRKSSDIQNRMLTSNSLALLADLNRRGRGVYIVATNYAEEFDWAVKRGGRFDLILKIMPPSKKAKLKYLQDQLAKEKVANVGKAEEFLEAKFDHGIARLTYIEWRDLIRRAIESAKKDKQDIDKALDRFFELYRQDSQISDDDLKKYQEQSKVFG